MFIRSKAHILFSLFAALLISRAAFSALPVGIPDPTGKVPAAIMPALPSAGSQISAFPYDPINMASPTWSNGSTQYYVNSKASNCDDSANGGRGNQTTPRCSIPGISGSSWTLAAGSQVFVVGDGASYGNQDDLSTIDMQGTSSKPIWIIGVGTTYPKLNFGRMYWVRGTHVVFEKVHFYSAVDNFRMTWDRAAGPVEYFTFRHLKCSGSDGALSGASRRCFSTGGTQANPNRFMVFYDVEVYGLGHWKDDLTTSTDMHGFQMQKWSRYIWLLNSKIYHLQGDSIQCGNSQWFDYDYPSRPHYIYIGGNEMYENYENAYDQKGCYHMVFSENHVHDFYNAKKGANGTAIITEQDSEGDIGGRNVWFLNNLVENTSNAFAAKATTSDGFIYMLGNTIRNINDVALAFTQRCYSGGSAGSTCPKGMVFANNTVDCSNLGTAVTNPQNPYGSDQQVEIDGNIFYNCKDGAQGTPHNWESFSEQPLNLIYRQNVDYRTQGGDITFKTARFDEMTGNIANEAVGLSSTASAIYSLGSSSPAVGLVKVQNDAYDHFQSMYGLSIRKDRYGNSWSASAVISAGANQAAAGSAGSAVSPPMPPSNVSGSVITQ